MRWLPARQRRWADADRQGDFARASSISSNNSRIPAARRLELLRRLAVLRQDKLERHRGFARAFEELVNADVTDDDVRRRYQEVSAALGRGAYAVRILASAVASVKNATARIRIQGELGQFAMQSGDLAGAREAFEQVIAAGGADEAVLVAAREMAKTYGSEEAVQLAAALEIVVRLEPDDAARWAATERLAALYQTELADPAKAVAAWSGLLDSPLRERAIDALEGLYGSSRDDEQLAILELRAHGSPIRQGAALATRR